MGDNYVVEYKELLEDDEFTPLNETVMVSEVRPRPPSTPQTVAKQKFTSAKLSTRMTTAGGWESSPGREGVTAPSFPRALGITCCLSSRSLDETKSVFFT
ncbi:hypothetical protein D8674_023783 [Pyrus ussuriensis x Pyrus communis]|uniref:Agenet-like domain-containing protein n=1 Tax=Pyrus ussuriensis x Pyrus communis TaxID=2448454 RepID=A0A5N5H5Z2_9ROSA|nr:hypothetical protein D8674_023783 [Pyrus ussuriensis x Pyrus communis]